MEFTTVAHALSSETRIRLLRIITEDPASSAEAFEQYQNQYDSPTRRESIYRELEKLADAGLATKQYESEDKKLVYAGRADLVCFDISQESVELHDQDH